MTLEGMLRGAAPSQEARTGDAGPRAGAAAWAVLLVLFLGGLALTPFIGPTPLDWGAALRGWLDGDAANADTFILFQLRLPRVLFVLGGGAALALAGAAYQAVLRNDLAEPFSLGVSSGAALGALIAFHAAPAALGAFAMPACAFAGALAAVGAIYMLARAKGALASPATLLLAGVTMNFLFGAAILFVQYLSDPYQTMMLLRWLMGGTDGATYTFAAIAAVAAVGTGLFLWGQGRALDVLSLGEYSAHDLGVSVGRVRLLALGVASLATALVVAFAGPIGFVGLIVPHAVRFVFGARHRVMIPACVLGGAGFLAWCDALARSALAGTELPVGILTAFLGAPFFLFLLMRKRMA